MNSEQVNKATSTQLKQIPNINTGDTIKIKLDIGNGRFQNFEGVVIARKGSGINTTVTVRKISNGVGVEKILPLHAPIISEVTVIKKGTVRKSKLYYLRERVGKKALLVNDTRDFESSLDKTSSTTE